MQRLVVLLFAVGSLLLPTACTGEPPEGTPEGTPPTVDVDGVRYVSLAEEVEALTSLVVPPGREDTLMVTEQRGRVLALPDHPAAEEAAVLLDMSDRVSSASWEAGLLALAFHPSHPEPPHLYVYYVADNPLRTVLSRFDVKDGAPRAIDPATEEVVLEIPQEDPLHNGGQIEFGPDGYLYLSIGDGGSGVDPAGHGQNPGTLLGTIIRVDVDNPEDGLAYGVPPDNPFVDDPDGRDEVWVYGLRNPWRFSIDTETGLAWVGNVGEDAWEEVIIARPGANYGWSVTEGGECYPPGADCDPMQFDRPVHTYPVHQDENCAVTGGYVYRGRALQDLHGVYVFGDFCSGRVWGLWHDGETVTRHEVLADTGLPITSFGEGPDGELYLVTHEGEIHRLVPDEDSDDWFALQRIGGGAP